MSISRLCCGAAVLAVSLGCSDGGGSAISGMILEPQFDVDGLDCTITPEKCQLIQYGINHLKSHASADCQDAGAVAQARYDAASGQGFTAGWHAEYDMFVNMGSADGTNWVPLDGYTRVSEGFWGKTESNNPAVIGGLIAHEELAHYSGMEGPDHELNLGYEMQALCGE